MKLSNNAKRALKVLKYLEAIGGFVTTEKLADLCQCNEMSIKRAIVPMIKNRIPIQRKLGPGGGFKLLNSNLNVWEVLKSLGDIKDPDQESRINRVVKGALVSVWVMDLNKKDLE